MDDEAKDKLWNDLIEAYHQYYNLRIRVLNELTRDEITEKLRPIVGRRHRSFTIDIARILKPEELQQVFDGLLFAATFLHSHTRDARELIGRMSKDWLKENIESYAKPILENEQLYLEDVRLLAIIYDSIDLELGDRLIEWASKHENPEIRAWAVPVDDDD